MNWSLQEKRPVFPLCPDPRFSQKQSRGFKRNKKHTRIPLVAKTADASRMLSGTAKMLFEQDLYASHVRQSLLLEKKQDSRCVMSLHSPSVLYDDTRIKRSEIRCKLAHSNSVSEFRSQETDNGGICIQEMDQFPYLLSCFFFLLSLCIPFFS